MLIYKSPLPPSELKTQTIHLSGGVIRNGSAYSYYLKDVCSNKYYSKVQIKGLTDTDVGYGVFEGLWGNIGVIECLYPAWVSIMQHSLKCIPIGCSVNINLIWVEGAFPIKTWEYILNLTGSTKNLRRMSQADKDEALALFVPYGDISFDILKLKGIPPKKLILY